MVLTGTFINGVCIIAGAFLGRLLQHMPEKIKETVMAAIGLAVAVLGLQMGFKSEQFLIVILSLVFGGAAGEWLDLDRRLNAAGKWLERKMKKGEESSLSQGFVTATLVFVIGAMAVIGSLDSGIRNDHDVLYTKGIIDGFTAIILSSTLGIGVLFSAVPVILYQGSIALMATQIDRMIPQGLMDSLILEITATGGIMIVAIGLNLLGLTKIRVANLLPGLMFAGLLAAGFYYFDINL